MYVVVTARSLLTLLAMSGGSETAKRNRRLGQQSTIDVSVGDPNQLAAIVVKRSENVHYVDDLAALIEQISS